MLKVSVILPDYTELDWAEVKSKAALSQRSIGEYVQLALKKAGGDNKPRKKATEIVTK